jgi:hypothetical protein
MLRHMKKILAFQILARPERKIGTPVRQNGLPMKSIGYFVASENDRGLLIMDLLFPSVL